MKTLTKLRNNEETYRALQSFESVEEMNKAVKQHKKLVNSKKHKNIYKLLDVISQYSCKYVGVSWLCQRTLAKMLGVDYRTVQRGFDKLEELGIVTIHECYRDGGDRRQTSNVYVINPIKDTSVMVEVSDHKTPQTSTKLTNTDVTEKAVPSQENVLSEALKSKLPEALQSVSYFFDTDTTYSIVGTIYKAKASIDKSISIEEHAQEFETTIKQVIQSYKMGKVRSFNGVIFNAIKNLCKSIKLKSQLNSVFGF